MKYKDIKTYIKRCNSHPDHQTGMITHQMVIDRLLEEIHDLREYIETDLQFGKLMANNRLYIEDTKNGDRLLVAKSFGNGWSWRADSDAITNWLTIHVRDAAASFGNTDASKSTLVFRTENEEEIGGEE